MSTWLNEDISSLIQALDMPLVKYHIQTKLIIDAEAVKKNKGRQLFTHPITT